MINMKKTYQNITIAVLALGFAACSQEDIAPQDNQKDTPITILSAGVADLSTRAITDGKLVGTEDESVEMGVFITDGSASKYNYQNVKYTHYGTVWTGEMMLYEGVGSAQNIYAYYPYAEGTTGTITVNATDQTDYLVATPAALTSSTVSFNMTHALTKLLLEAELGTDLDGDAIAKVEVQDMYASGTWTIADNSWDVGETPTFAALEMKNNVLLVIPMSSCTSFPLVITTGKGRVFKADVTCPEIGKDESNALIYGLAPGTAYTIKLRVGKDKVELGGITADAWTSVTMNEPLETE